jgi:hypothetical protein
MTIHITRAEFEKRMPELLDQVRRTGEALFVSDGAFGIEMKPVDKPKVYTDEMRAHDDAILARLRGSVTFHDGSLDPVGEEDWEILK